ncbi:MAG: LysM domain protein [Firmicutes bacterium ADurb.Bin193]|nr:MAG: LysM domain protein [Firmicutes bacterium ADurb.Bin193]
MMIEYQHEPVCVSEAAITAFSQAYTEADIIVPDVKPDIAKVLQIDARAVILSKECSTDRITVEGKATLNILYVGEDNSVKSINSAQNFTHYIDVKGAAEGMGIELESDVENVEYEVINSRKINVRTLIGLDVKAFMPRDINVLTNVMGGEFETLRKKIKPYSVVARIDDNTEIKEKLEIPAGKPSIASILKIDARVKESELKVSTNKLIIKGTLCVTTLYLGDMDRDVIQFMEHEVPFTEIFDVPSADDGMDGQISFAVTDITYDIVEDSDGDSRILIVCVAVAVTGKVARQLEIDVIEDIYSVNTPLYVAKNTANLDKMVENTRVQVTVNDVATVSDESPEIVQVYNVIAKPYLSETRIENGKIVVEGVVDAYILYMSDDKSCPLYTHKHEMRFSHNMDGGNACDDMYCDVKLDIDHISYNIAMGREVQLRIILGISAKVICTDRIEYVTEVAASDESAEASEKKKCCIKIYFVQKGDKLWDIAKKYRTTMDKIMQMNDISDESEIIAGKQIIIP